MKITRRVPRGLTWALWIAGIACSVLLMIVGILFWNQDAIVQQGIRYANETFAGRFTVSGSHISPFANFPYISVDLEGLRLYETKSDSLEPLLAVEDLYVGVNLWSILNGEYEIKAILLRDGFVHLAQHADGTFNLLEAVSSIDSTQVDSTSNSPLNLDLKHISLSQIDLHKISEATDTDIDAFITDASIQISLEGSHTRLGLAAQSEMSLILAGDTTYLNHKHVEIDTELDYDGESLLSIAPSSLAIEGGSFEAAGEIFLSDDPTIDLTVKGSKPNFDMLIAFCPDDLIPTLKTYDNRGEVFFEAEIEGSIASGDIPQINAIFGCDEGMIKNNQTNRALEDLAFQGYLRSGESGGLESMEFGLQDFRAKPETGEFAGDLTVKNFDSPDIDLQLRSAFDLNFLVDFFGLEGLSDLSGSVNLVMNFHDIIDLNHPEKSIERLNESYFTELEIRDLSFKSEGFHLPIKQLNVIGHIEGHEMQIDTLMGMVGNSDIFASGRISDIPAIIHHGKDSVWVDLNMKAALLDIAELTYDDSTQQAAVDEQITDFRLDLGFSSSAYAFTESPHLPIGEFFIRELHAQLQHYPHELHDFRADVFVEEEDLRIVDFSGELDSSDFHFIGRLEQYHRWLQDTVAGDTRLDFDFTSDLLRLEDLFTYQGVNYVPEDYRHEELRNLALKGRSALHFQANELQSVDLYLDELAGKLNVHDSRFEDVKGRLHYEDEHLTADNFRGNIGRSDVAVDLFWYVGEDPALQKEDHRIALRSSRLDLNQLLDWNPSPAATASLEPSAPVDHDSAFSLFDLPFWDMTVTADIDWLSYHTYEIYDLATEMRMLKERYLYLDECTMNVAGGEIDLDGYFDARDSTNIYLAPKLTANHIDLDQFMVKFENFGQDYIVSDNLHGIVDCNIDGRLHLHKDLTPMVDASELSIEMEVQEGRLDNYEPMNYLAEYFADKNLSRVRFDTLRNTFVLKDNVLEIPRMTINSSLGFMELGGTQDLGETLDLDLFLKIPLSLVSQATLSKLFKRPKEEVNPEQEDSIIFQDEEKKVAYTYIRLLSDIHDYEVKLMKKSEIEASGLD